MVSKKWIFCGSFPVDDPNLKGVAWTTLADSIPYFLQHVSYIYNYFNKSIDGRLIVFKVRKRGLRKAKIFKKFSLPNNFLVVVSHPLKKKTAFVPLCKIRNFLFVMNLELFLVNSEDTWILDLAHTFPQYILAIFSYKLLHYENFTSFQLAVMNPCSTTDGMKL